MRAYIVCNRHCISEDQSRYFHWENEEHLTTAVQCKGMIEVTNVRPSKYWRFISDMPHLKVLKQIDGRSTRNLRTTLMR